MWRIVFPVICLGFIGISVGKSTSVNDTISSSDSHRKGKFFPFYTLGRFSRESCVGSNQLMGTCVISGECDELGGTSAGRAACSGANTKQATCCVLSKACGGTTQYRNTYFYNPGYPSVFAGGSRCNYQVTRESTDICQLRIDFLEFSLAQPSGDGVCNTDYLAVTGGGSAVPRICGENAGSHVYVDFNGNAPITVTMASSGTTTFNRRWHMLMTQIECDSASRAPSGCLQYYLEPSGSVKGFNYSPSSNGNPNSIGVQGGRQIASANYGACIKMAPGQCTITWAIPTSDRFAFTVTGDVGVVDPTLLGTSALQSQACTTDYVVIPAPTQLNANGIAAPLGSDRFCGLGIADTTSSVKPFVLYSVTNANETPDIGNRGFWLTYSQNMCPV
ncbi:unnamed protein product [Diamesa hyperborea]